MTIKKSLLTIAISCFIGLSHHVAANDFQVAAEHAIAVEVSTGKILYEKDAKTPDAIASITKILTVYMVYEEISKGHLSWDSQVAISDYAYELTHNYAVSNVPMEARQYTVKQLVDAALIASSNSAAIALAEKISGSEPEFVNQMTKQLEEWGITDAKLVNASGLNNGFLGQNIHPNSTADDENTMSAQSVAIIAKHLVTDYPEILSITSQANVDFAGTLMHTYNQLIEGQPFSRPGVTGLKTGTSEQAGASLVTTSIENGMQVITVILNADHSDQESNTRFAAANSLLDYIANNYQMSTLVTKGNSFNNKSVKVTDGKKDSVTAVASQEVRVVTPKNSTELKVRFDDYQVTAPVSTETVVGKLTYDDTYLVGDGYLSEPPSTPLVAGEAVQRANFLKVWWNHFITYLDKNL